MAGGRPSKYEERYCEDIVDFFSVEHSYFDKMGCEKPNKLPTFEKYAVKIGVTIQTLLNWCDVHPMFFEAYKKCKGLQKDMLVDLGLRGLYNPTFTIFTAKNITDMTDKKQVDHSSEDGSMSQKPIYIEVGEKKAVEDHISDVIDGD